MCTSPSSSSESAKIPDANPGLGSVCFFFGFGRCSSGRRSASDNLCRARLLRMAVTGTTPQARASPMRAPVLRPAKGPGHWSGRAARQSPAGIVAVVTVILTIVTRSIIRVVVVLAVVLMRSIILRRHLGSDFVRAPRAYAGRGCPPGAAATRGLRLLIRLVVCLKPTRGASPATPLVVGGAFAAPAPNACPDCFLPDHARNPRLMGGGGQR